jgi:hypothetical protein
MALTEQKIKDLTDKKFDELYTRNKTVWLALAKNAHEYAKSNITSGREPRPDDIAAVLLPIVKPNDALRDHQEDNKAKSARYAIMFTEYVVDQFLAGR